MSKTTPPMPEVHPHAPPPTVLDRYLLAGIERCHANWRLLTLAAVAVFLAVCFVLLWGQWRQARLARGYEAVANAQDPEALAGLAREFAGSRIGANATFTLARMLFDNGAYDRAATRYESFLKDYPANELVPAAKLGEACAREAMKDYLAAEKKYLSITVDIGNPDRVAEAYLGAARCAVALHRSADAQKYAGLAVASGAGETWKQNALDVLRELQAGPAVADPAAVAPAK